MKSFSLYEQVGVIIPGSVLLFGIILLAPDLRSVFDQGGITIGGLGVFVLLAYAVGHGVAAIGNALETLWWWWFDGMPSTWVVGSTPKILRPEQVEMLQERVRDRLEIRDCDIRKLTSKEWTPIFWQLYRDVLANAPGRVEVFNGNYGLNRGLCAALLSLAVVVLCFWPDRWRAAILCLIGAAIYLWRMHRFGVHFSREVFTGFILLPAKREAASDDSGRN
jgi:hypothetical protein